MKFYVIIFLLLCSCNKYDDSLSPEELTKIDSLTGSYIYPVERSEKKLFELGWERYYDTCMVPSNILNHLTDQGIIESCLNYPPFFNIFYFDNYQDGFNHILEESNVFDGLFARRNISGKLISRYQSFEVDSFNLSNFLQKGTTSLFYLEIILAQNQIIKRLSIIEKREIIKEAFQKYEYREMVLNEELFSSIASALLVGRIFKTIQYDEFMKTLLQDQSLNTFLEKGAFYDTTSASKIFYYSREYLKK